MMAGGAPCRGTPSRRVAAARFASTSTVPWAIRIGLAAGCDFTRPLGDDGQDGVGFSTRPCSRPRKRQRDLLHRGRPCLGSRPDCLGVVWDADAKILVARERRV